MRLLALIRGVNVGGKRLPMGELRDLASGLGFGEARTYIQTGNVIFDAPGLDPSRIARRLEETIANKLGLEVRVITRTLDQLATLERSNPFLGDEPNHSRIHVVFLDQVPEPHRVAALAPDRSPPDRFVVIGREVFVHYPNGMGRSKLGLDYFEKVLGTPGTIRNWNTVVKLKEMTEG